MDRNIDDVSSGEIEIKEVASVLWNRKWIILASGVLIAVFALLYSLFFITPQYTSNTGVYILNKQNADAAMTYNDLQMGTQLAQDYITMVKSRSVLETTISQLDLDMSSSVLHDSIQVSNPSNTRIINITVQHSDPKTAKKIADKIRDVSSELILEVMELEQVNIIERANLPTTSSGVNVKRNVFLGGFLGLVLSAFIIILIHFLDDTIKTPKDIENYLGLSVLGSIPFQSELKVAKVKRKRIRRKK